MKFSVDPWDPGYGTSESGELDVSSAELNLELERPVGDWAPVTVAAGDDPEVVWFCDGVRRIEARIWIDDGAAEYAGICASYAAGVVRCSATSAEVVAIDVRRGVFSAAAQAEPIVTAHGEFVVQMAASSAPEVLSLALQEQMTRAEVVVADAVVESGGGLLVVDGPLRGRQHLQHAVGMIKSQHTDYLPVDLIGVLRALEAGQRTPVFTIGGSSWTRHSWYVRLPGPGGSPRAGIVRLECSPQLSAAAAVAMADTSARVLPRYASAPHKDTRAPQNLYPIAGLERELRHRLGDPALMYRALRSVAGA